MNVYRYELGSYDLTVPLTAKKRKAVKASEAAMSEAQKEWASAAMGTVGAAKKGAGSWLSKLVQGELA